MNIENPKIFWPFAVGYVAVIVGALTYILVDNTLIGFIIFSVGALAVAATRLLSLKKSDNTRTRRLQMQQIIGVGCMLASGYLMYVENSAWAITLLISAFIDIWLSFRMK